MGNRVSPPIDKVFVKKNDHTQTCILLSLLEKTRRTVPNFFSERKTTVQRECEGCAWEGGVQLAPLLLSGADRSFITGAGAR